MSNSTQHNSEQPILSIHGDVRAFIENGSQSLPPEWSMMIMFFIDRIEFREKAKLLKPGRDGFILYPDNILKFADEIPLIGKTTIFMDVVGTDNLTHHLELRLNKSDAQNFIRELNELKKDRDALKGVDRALLLLIKPREEISLRDVAKDKTFLNNLSVRWKRRNREMSEDNILSALRGRISSMIVDGELDGVLDGDIYIAKTKLARKTVQYHVTIDFAGLFSQLKNKGVVLQKIECPSCHGELALPDSGDVMVCKFCNTTVRAIDIFEKFKALLS